MENRIVKFRAWDDGIMVTSGDLGDFFKFIREDAPIMQFTGLIDKNGTPIYEGDILFCEFEKSKFLNYSDIYLKKWTHEVKWEGQGWNIPNIEIEFREAIATSMHNDGKPTPQWEIIGNIYQNVDLLK